jgi:hypothetical protein
VLLRLPIPGERAALGPVDLYVLADSDVFAVDVYTAGVARRGSKIVSGFA